MSRWTMALAIPAILLTGCEDLGRSWEIHHTIQRRYGWDDVRLDVRRAEERLRVHVRIGDRVGEDSAVGGKHRLAGEVAEMVRSEYPLGSVDTVLVSFESGWRYGPFRKSASETFFFPPGVEP